MVVVVVFSKKSYIAVDIERRAGPSAIANN